MAHINRTQVHTGPTMWIEAADFTCERTGTKLEVSGKFTLTMKTGAGAKFGFNYAIRGKYNGGQSQEVKKNPHLTNSNSSSTFEFDFEFNAEAKGTLKLYACCYGTPTDSGCTVNSDYTEFEFFSMDYPAAMEKASIILEDWSPISRYDSQSAWFTWNKVSNQSSKTSQTINGSGSNSSNTGDNSGRRDYKPSDYNNVKAGSNYQIVVKRENSIPSSATDSATLYTYTTPTLDDITYKVNQNGTYESNYMNTDNAVNANNDFNAAFGGGPCVNDGKSSSRASGGKTKTTSDKHKLIITLNNVEISTSTTSGTNYTNNITIISSQIMRAVPYNSSYDTDGQEVELKVVKSHADDGSISSVTKTRKVKVRYTPIIAPAWPAAPETGYRLNNASGTIIKKNSVVEKDSNTKIYVYWTWPNDGKHQEGIVDGYRVIIRSGVNQSTVSEYDVSVPRGTRSGNLTVNSTSIKFGTNNVIEISAYYKHTDGSKHYGPALKDQFPSVVTKLQPPKLLYPTNGSEWINKNYRVLFTLPEDGDYNDYDKTIKENYEYGGVEIDINGVILSFSSNPTIFSLTKLFHMAKLAINPSLASNYPNRTQYTYKVRIKKKYGYEGMDQTVADPWSDWSSSMVVNIVPDVFSVVRGEYIMASHYNTLDTLTERINKAYPLFNKITKKVNVGDYIMADDFYLPYKDITGCFNAVNGWGEYDSSRNKVKFNKGIDLPEFTAIIGEYITALEDDEDFPGRNYIWKMHTLANMMK